MSGRMSRNKGHNFEREVARLLTEATKVPYVRNLEEVRTGQGIDVQPVTGRGLHVQCKAGARPPIWRAMREVIDGVGSKPGALPVVMAHRTSSSKRTEKVVVMRLDDFLEFVDHIHTRKANGDD